MKPGLRSIHYLTLAITALAFLGIACSSDGNQPKASDETASPQTQWVGSWSTAPQLTEPRNNPPTPGLEGNTLRQVFRVSIGGDELRMRFSNEFSESPVTLKRVSLAKSEGFSKIDLASRKPLLFNGSHSVTIEPGGAVYSDTVALSVQPLSELTVTIAFDQVPEGITGHPGSRTTSYILPGEKVDAPAMEWAVKTDHWYIMTGLNVKAPENAAAIAIMGDSITDGRGSGTNKQNRWPDELATRLQKYPGMDKIGVLNQGIGGNCVTKPCLGPAGVNRFERDVLNQKGVKWLIILEGINDIGSNRTTGKAQEIIAVYQEMIRRANAVGIKVYGATLTPIKGSGYESPGSLEAVKTVNHWIRHSGQFDAVIDFSEAVSDPENSGYLRSEYDSGDGLHLSEKGYRAMAEAIDLSLFEQ